MGTTLSTWRNGEICVQSACQTWRHNSGSTTSPLKPIGRFRHSRVTHTRPNGTASRSLGGPTVLASTNCATDQCVRIEDLGANTINGRPRSAAQSYLRAAMTKYHSTLASWRLRPVDCRLFSAMCDRDRPRQLVDIDNLVVRDAWATVG